MFSKSLTIFDRYSAINWQVHGKFLAEIQGIFVYFPFINISITFIIDEIKIKIYGNRSTFNWKIKTYQIKIIKYFFSTLVDFVLFHPEYIYFMNRAKIS